ncbi:unnamed protein product [Cylindrotheca closterium]|uniref:Bicarbonate transporter-like transmembrane domain-containing protein n=1 Tax=Cylindrotheca closterium TaxID=2856 RepID=A0AAD2FHN5_9STRA|nr:unnamed protein product [Cylindrotheca closterium]
MDDPTLAEGTMEAMRNVKKSTKNEVIRESSSTKTPTIQFLTGMKKDLAARVPLYWDDWKCPRSPIKVLNATWFVFVVQLIPALIFAELLDRQTQGRLAVAEVILSAGLISVIYALLAGQPLVLLGITGPVAILLGKSYRLAEDYDAEYFTFFWWLCMWAALLHMLSAMFGVVNFVWHISSFSTQTFELFIATTFIYQSIRELVQDIHFRDAQSDERSAAYASLVVGAMTFVICWKLHFAEQWDHFNASFRTFLKSYNMLIALVVMTALSYLPGVAQDSDGRKGIERVFIRRDPWDWRPTTEPGIEPRPWVADPLDGIDVRGIFGALFPAFMLYLLFFIDHNISSIMTQAPKYNLKKPSAYHWDFFVLGLTMIPCGIMGIPPGSGLIPEAPLHSKSLCTRKFKIIDGVRREVFSDCEEQRWSNMGQALLMFAILAVIVVISWIPVGCLFGIFLYLGVDAMHGNEIWERINLMLMRPKRRPPIPAVAKTSSWRVVQLYTFIQFSLMAVTFGIAQFATWGYAFPALIACYVPVRSFVVPKLISAEDLKQLDPPTRVSDDDDDETSGELSSEKGPDPTGKESLEDSTRDAINV